MLKELLIAAALSNANGHGESPIAKVIEAEEKRMLELESKMREAEERESKKIEAIEKKMEEEKKREAKRISDNQQHHDQLCSEVDIMSHITTDDGCTVYGFLNNHYDCNSGCEVDNRSVGFWSFDVDTFRYYWRCK